MLGYIDSVPHGLSSSRNVGCRAVGIRLAAGHLQGEKRCAPAFWGPDSELCVPFTT